MVSFTLSSPASLIAFMLAMSNVSAQGGGHATAASLVIAAADSHHGNADVVLPATGGHSALIQAAIDMLQDASSPEIDSAEVVFLAGTYNIDAPIWIKFGNMRLRGESPRAIHTSNNTLATAGTVWNVTGSAALSIDSRVVVGGVHQRIAAVDVDSIIFNGVSPGVDGIQMSHANDVYITRCQFTDLTRAVLAEACWDTTTEKCTFDSCGSYDPANIKAGAAVQAWAVGQYQCAGWRLEDCTWQDIPGVGFYSTRNGGDSNTRIMFEGCKFDGASAAGTKPHIVGAMSRSSIVGCVFNTCWETPTASGPEGCCIFLGDPNASGNMAEANDNLVSACSFLGWAEAAVKVHAGWDNLLVGNAFANVSQKPAWIPSGTPSPYCVKLTASAHRTCLQANVNTSQAAAELVLDGGDRTRVTEPGGRWLNAMRFYLKIPNPQHDPASFDFEFAGGGTVEKSLSIRPGGLLRFPVASGQAQPSNTSQVVKWLRVEVVDSSGAPVPYFIPLYQ